MTKEGAPATAWGKGLLITGGVCVLVLGAVYFGLKRDGAPLLEQIAVSKPVEEASTEPAASATEKAAQATEAEPGAQTAAEEPTQVPEETAEGVAADDNAPRIEDVRLEADGLAVIAGRAAPGSSVSVEINGVGTVEAEADARGHFAAITTIAPDGTAPVLTLTQKNEEGEVTSSEEVILAPVTVQAAVTPEPENKEEQAAATVPSSSAREPAAEPEVGAEVVEAAGSEPATGDVSGEVVAAASDAEPNQPSTAEAEAEEPQAKLPAETGELEGATVVASLDAKPEPQAPVTVLKSTEAGVEVLQNLPKTLNNVMLDTIGYSEAGEVQLSGRAQERTGEIRVYLNNNAVATLPVDEEGRWRGDLPEVESGVYTLRVDAVDEAGAVISRVETPFKRETPEVLAAASIGGEGPVRAVTVQTGDTLWAIARGRYGEGLLYVKVFEANRQAIRNPDLIYPGQVFDLPE